MKNTELLNSNQKDFAKSLESAGEREVNLHLTFSFIYKKVKVSCEYNSEDGDFCSDYNYPKGMSENKQDEIWNEIDDLLHQFNVSEYALSGKVSINEEK